MQKQECTEEVVKLQSEKQEMKTVLQKMDKRLCDTMAAVDDLQEEIREGNKKAEELTKQNKTMEERSVQLKEEHSRLSDAIEIAVGRRILLEDGNQELLDRNQNLKDDNSTFRKQNNVLEKEYEAYRNKIEQIANRATSMERDIRKYEEDPEWKLPEASSFASDKSYRENCARPLWRRLIAQIKKLAMEIIGLISLRDKLKATIETLENRIKWLKDDLKLQNHKIERLEAEVADYNRVKWYMGEDKVQQAVDIVKSFEEQERERKKLHRSREWSR